MQRFYDVGLNQLENCIEQLTAIFAVYVSVQSPGRNEATYQIQKIIEVYSSQLRQFIGKLDRLEFWNHCVE